MPGLAPGFFIWKTLSKTGIIPAYKKTTREEFDMARVALVTGGTRGIGAAISNALKTPDYKVAATYAGNDAANCKTGMSTRFFYIALKVLNRLICVDEDLGNRLRYNQSRARHATRRRRPGPPWSGA